MTAPRLMSIVALALTAAPAVATTNEFAPQLQVVAEAEVAPIAASPDIVAAVRAQNAETAGLDQPAIDALDADWRAQVGAASAPMIEAVLDRAASAWLRARQEASGGVITEIFVTDARGLNVAQSAVTSDYWQGDEAKWKEVFGTAPGTVHLGEVEFDESAQTYQSQISVPVVDPASGEALGTVTVGVDLELLP